MKVPKWFFLIFICSCIFFDCDIVNGESILQVNKPLDIDSKQEKLNDDTVILNEKLDQLYKRKEELGEAILETDKEIFKIQKMIIEKSVNGN